MVGTHMGHRAGGAVSRARRRALRPVGRGGRSAVRLPRALPLASRPPRTAAFDGSASLPIIPPCRASRALATASFDGCTYSPSLRIRSQARCGASCLQDTDSYGQPSFLRLPVRIVLPRSFRRGEGRAARCSSLPPRVPNRLAAGSAMLALMSRGHAPARARSSA